MSKQKKKKNNSTEEKNYFIISLDKKKKLIGILLIALSLLIFFSILSYSRYDEHISDYGITYIFKVFSSNQEFINNAKGTHNWLGIFGALISYFFINSTIGYFSIVFPVILFIWGYSILFKKSYQLAVYYSNFLIISGVILASFFGLFRNSTDFELFTGISELSGNIGDFFGNGINILLGGLGGLILLTTLFVATLIIAFDVKIEKIFQFLKAFYTDDNKYDDKINIKYDSEQVEKTGANLDKIKGFRKARRKKKVKDEAAFDDSLESEEKETRIRIVKKEEPEKDVVEEESTDIKKQVKAKSETEKLLEEAEVERNTEGEKELPDQWEEQIEFDRPKLDLLDEPSEELVKIPEEELKKNAELLKEKLSLFDIQIEDISVTPGPVVTLYEIVPAPGVKISRIVSLEHDIALALAARGIRIIAPIPGKSAIGVEIPNSEASLVGARPCLAKLKDSKAELPLALGKTISGDVYITDLATMPHLLIAGSTGAGKSVGINMMIISLIYSKHPSDIKFVIIDPKKIELSFYKLLNKHYLAVSPDLDEEIITNPQNALLVLRSVEYEMEKRYNKLAKAGARNIVDYNNKISDPKKRPKDTPEMKHHKMPYIVIIIDELADLMLSSGKEVEEPIARLAQLARAVGIHLVLATQRPSVNVITGVIKANFSARIAYQVATKIDSRTILDMNGAEQLLGRGDMLFLPGGLPKPIRIQNAFISTDEVERITKFIYQQGGYSKRYFLPSMFEKKAEQTGNFLADLDPMFEDAARVIVRHQQGSVSLLQRRLKLGYSRAARIVDQLEQAGIVGPSEGSKAREVIIENEEQLETLLRSL